jgi:hypothetical protein
LGRFNSKFLIGDTRDLSVAAYQISRRMSDDGAGQRKIFIRIDDLAGH